MPTAGKSRHKHEVQVWLLQTKTYGEDWSNISKASPIRNIVAGLISNLTNLFVIALETAFIVHNVQITAYFNFGAWLRNHIQTSHWKASIANFPNPNPHMGLKTLQPDFGFWISV